ncbi:polyhydroxyalkanoate depolymerase [Caenimonas koreensis]|uniref:Polyhydroxyalkanoate depolymerase n=1 Tax=Caenimonas koreensis DSM 17982 TaxID=1121255 RepID=A0A844AT22_9BURK|nr:polyhydroxyalkanoate depolymerase [Caenimonas koreensis]MRD47485.1 polyhydroxyalkanoate depolymerase [Caenimonas koreensis DSM 17982]
MLYHAYQAQSDLMSPLRLLAQHTGAALWLRQTEGTVVRKIAAMSEVFSRMRLTHSRPAYNIASVQVATGETRAVVEEAAFTLPFGTLLHFRKPHSAPQPPVLLVAPLSGHFATLLRETARTLLADHDVYITDWHNARDVPLRDGEFGLDEYIDYMIRFIEAIGTGVHVVAVCQPCVAALAAVAIMAEDDNPAQPRSLTLMAGPVDCRINPTGVNALATSKPIEWFEQNLISHVPFPHKGHMRRVYPGFVQLSAFLSMNPERHKQQFRNLFDHIVRGEDDQADTIRVFYDEYLAVNDLPAKFYLETVEKVFQTYDLAAGKLMWRGRKVDPAAIRRTWLFTVEGERDDICAMGQTLAAHDLCSSIRPYKKSHHMQTGVGHYGVFSGRRWNRHIYPRLRDIVHSASE